MTPVSSAPLAPRSASSTLELPEPVRLRAPLFSRVAASFEARPLPDAGRGAFCIKHMEDGTESLPYRIRFRQELLADRRNSFEGNQTDLLRRQMLAS